MDPCSERLPEGLVICCDKEGNMLLGYLRRSATGYIAHDYAGTELYGCVAWMPLPDAYCEENEKMKYSERLKPCPFCGKKAEFRTNTTGTNGENFKYRFNIRCRNCGMNSSHIYGVEITFRNGDFVIIEDERDKAVEEWNRRAEDGKTD